MYNMYTTSNKYDGIIVAYYIHILLLLIFYFNTV